MFRVKWPSDEINVSMDYSKDFYIPKLKLMWFLDSIIPDYLCGYLDKTLMSDYQYDKDITQGNQIVKKNVLGDKVFIIGVHVNSGEYVLSDMTTTKNIDPVYNNWTIDIEKLEDEALRFYYEAIYQNKTEHNKIKSLVILK